MSEAVLSCRGLKKTYVQGRVEVPVLAGVDLDKKKSTDKQEGRKNQKGKKRKGKTKKKKGKKNSREIGRAHV